MPDNHAGPQRRSIRWQGYDYASAGAYFVTLCTQGRQPFFGSVVDGEMRLNEAGEMVQETWLRLPDRFPMLDLDVWVLMPNHMHAIVLLHDPSPTTRRGELYVRPQEGIPEGDHKDRPYIASPPDAGHQEERPSPRGTLPGSLGRILQAFKSLATNVYIHGVDDHGWLPFDRRLWQRNYWDRVIRNERELWALQEYIQNNPAQWAQDRLNPLNPWRPAKAFLPSGR